MVPDHVAKHGNVRPSSSTSNRKGFYLEDKLRNVCFVDVLHEQQLQRINQTLVLNSTSLEKTEQQKYVFGPERGTASPESSTQTVPLRQMSEKRRSDVCTAWSTCSGNQNPKRSFWKRTGTSQRTQRRARTTGSSWCRALTLPTATFSQIHRLPPEDTKTNSREATQNSTGSNQTFSAEEENSLVKQTKKKKRKGIERKRQKKGQTREFGHSHFETCDISEQDWMKSTCVKTAQNSKLLPAQIQHLCF